MEFGFENCVGTLFSRSEPFYKTLNIEQKAIFGQKKLAVNKTNKSLARVNIFCSTGTATILTDNFSTN